MIRERKLPEIPEVTKESNQFTFLTIERSSMKRCTARRKVFDRKYHWAIARTNQQDWQKSENGLRENIWSGGHPGTFVAIMTGVGKTLTIQQWHFECIGKAFIANGGS
jgi:hypothetical protein